MLAVELVVPLVCGAPVLESALPVLLLPDAVAAVPAVLEDAAPLEPTAVVLPVPSPLAVPTSSPQAEPATRQSINAARDMGPTVAVWPMPCHSVSVRL